MIIPFSQTILNTPAKKKDDGKKAVDHDDKGGDSTNALTTLVPVGGIATIALSVIAMAAATRE